MFICYDFLYASSVNTFDFGMSIVAFCNSGRPDICYMYIILLLQGLISCIVFMSCGKDTDTIPTGAVWSGHACIWAMPGRVELKTGHLYMEKGDFGIPL